ncbi:MAG: phosphotransferase family protein [Spirochaetes bacterium]|nr:phosphotransferase family protein [Spirochaetota bacterium]
MKSIENVISMVDDWKGKEVDIEEITAGITNKNFKVTVEEKSFIVRIPGEGTDLFINREVELHNLLSASDVRVGANIFKYFKPDYIVISDFINGKVMSAESFKNKKLIVKALEAIKQINTEGKFTSTFIMFDYFDTYLQLAKKHSMEVPKNFKDAERIVQKVREKFLKNMPVLAPCHNDLLAENFIDQGDRMRIIDWEFSGMNDPCFEIGDFSVEQDFGEDEDMLIVETYFGKFDESKFARMNIYKSMADILWTLYAMIQNHFSKIDFDHWEYGINRFNRAMKAMNTDEFSQWLKIS